MRPAVFVALALAAVMAVAVAVAMPVSQQSVLTADADTDTDVDAAALALVDPDAKRTTPELAAARGYVCESHDVTTADGYRLTLHRLPPVSKAGKSAANKAPKKLTKNGPSNGRVVVLQHGLMDTSAGWVLNGATDSLGFVLSSAGYDVWLANSRGNRYTGLADSNNNKGGNAFDFDFDDMAYYDVPAVVSYVTARTNAKRVSWVCHSQGCAVSIAAFAKPGTGAVIDRLAALAPVTYLRAHGSPLMRALVTARVDHVFRLLPPAKFVPSGPVLSTLLGSACNMAPGVCDSVVSGLFGATGPNLPRTRTGVYFAHFPDGTSTRNIAHWTANARSGEYADNSGNAYDLSQYAVPTGVWYGARDLLADPTDVQTLVAHLNGPAVVAPAAAAKGVRNVVGAVALDTFAHMDFTWSPAAKQLLFPALLNFLRTGAMPPTPTPTPTRTK